MKRFIIKTSIFICATLIIFALFEILARAIPNSYKKKTEYMNCNHHIVKTLIFGNSSMYAGINASLMDDSYSLANSAQGLEYDLFLLEKYIDRCDSLRNVVIAIDYYNLWGAMSLNRDAQDGFRLTYYNIYMDYDIVPWYSKWNFEISNPKSFKLKVSSYLKSVISGKPFYTCDSLGRGSNYFGHEEQGFGENYITNSIKAIQRNYKESNLLFNKQIIEKIDSLCDRRKIRLIATCAPMYKDYLEHINKERELQSMAIARELSDKLKFEYHDLHRAESIINNRELFYNANHLNQRGAYIYTSLLNEIISNKKNE